MNVIKLSTLISQGAEAKVYKGHLTSASDPILLKHRFHKTYRHATLDASLTKARVTGEARILVRCLKYGVKVPGVRLVDLENGLIGLEWIEGMTVRKILGGGDEDELAEDALDEVVEDEDHLQAFGIEEGELMKLIGIELGKMHVADIIHGDLTTSNLMLKRSPTGTPEVFIIDFGLASVSSLVEDKAVDLYVLERAFASTHPDSEPKFQAVLDAYATHLASAWDTVYKRLEEGVVNFPGVLKDDLD